MSISTHEESRSELAAGLTEFLIGTLIIAAGLTLIILTGASTLIR
jgi:TRAP-type mannitol/chloroaromatic compound transport system permease small subunit